MTARMCLFLSTFFLAGTFLFGCSKSEGAAEIVAPAALASCFYEASNQCYEYHSAAVLDSEKPFCALGNGTWKDSSGCKAAGKVKGCQVNAGGAKAMVFWTYDATDGPAAVDYFCDPASDVRVSGATKTIVVP
ncbi:MAG: hypothetical protein ACO3A4_08765 [Silvanigrellaceae bacterium]